MTHAKTEFYNCIYMNNKIRNLISTERTKARFPLGVKFRTRLLLSSELPCEMKGKTIQFKVPITSGNFTCL